MIYFFTTKEKEVLRYYVEKYPEPKYGAKVSTEGGKVSKPHGNAINEKFIDIGILTQYPLFTTNRGITPHYFLAVENLEAFIAITMESKTKPDFFETLLTSDYLNDSIEKHGFMKIFCAFFVQDERDVLYIKNRCDEGLDIVSNKINSYIHADKNLLKEDVVWKVLQTALDFNSNVELFSKSFLELPHVKKDFKNHLESRREKYLIDQKLGRHHNSRRFDFNHKNQFYQTLSAVLESNQIYYLSQFSRKYLVPFYRENMYPLISTLIKETEDLSPSVKELLLNDLYLRPFGRCSLDREISEGGHGLIGFIDYPKSSDYLYYVLHGFYLVEPSDIGKLIDFYDIIKKNFDEVSEELIVGEYSRRDCKDVWKLSGAILLNLIYFLILYEIIIRPLVSDGFPAYGFDHRPVLCSKPWKEKHEMRYFTIMGSPTSLVLKDMTNGRIIETIGTKNLDKKEVMRELQDKIKLLNKVKEEGYEDFAIDGVKKEDYGDFVKLARKFFDVLGK